MAKSFSHRLGPHVKNLAVSWVRQGQANDRTFAHLHRRAAEESAAFIYDFMHTAVLFTELEPFWTYTAQHIPATGALLEFGVFQGHSINFLSRALAAAGDRRTLFGFDAFEGLSEPWGGTTLATGHFDRAGTLPKVNDNVTLVKGWIDETLPPFVSAQDVAGQKVAFVHVDVDTYAPTRTILASTQSHFQPGTIVMFDELLGYPGWKEHEFRALREELDPHWDYEFIAFCELQKDDFTSQYVRASLRITRPKR